MKHTVHFHNAENHWDNGLPLGNGCFGAMLYFEDHKLYMPMNHYEVYYNIKKSVLPRDLEKDSMEADASVMTAEGASGRGAAHRIFRERADANQPRGEEPYTIYRTDSCKAMDPEPYAIGGFSGSYPMTGDVSFCFSEELRDSDETLTLYVEDAAAELVLKNAEKQISLHTITAREDCIVTRVCQDDGLLKSVTISMEPYRDIEPPEVEFLSLADDLFAYRVSRLFDGADTPFVFVGMIKILGAKAKMNAGKYSAELVLSEAEQQYHLLTGVFSAWRYADPLGEGIKMMGEYAENLAVLYAEHKAYWDGFFSRSSITLPDPFLEHVYYVNQYALDACSGKDGIMKHHACGLNGLWDVKHPTLWGSMWYWDVNIQASFAGVFSSNRLELAKVFSDGLRSYINLAENYAKTVHDMPGCAIDYPYQAYYSVWPWCAQYLWFLYEYSLDEEYLRNEAYPLFLKLCEFCTALFEYNAETDTYDVYPDISPEQGPFAHNTTITVASVKYLLQFTLKAAEILGDESPILADVRRLYEKMPPYSFSKDGKYGVHLKDSPDAADDMWIRHPSMLMPLFPIGEFDAKFTDQEMLKILSNTVDFLDENAEIGIFGGSWIAAAAARLGRGQTALRIIYERGLDHMLRSNGLTAEATERFMNFCLTSRQPLYYPCMMEFTGEMLAAVNEMLLQSQNDLIRVFPAIPDGSPEWERMTRNGYSLTEYQDRCAVYDAWKNVRFDTMLAKGAFEISAELCEGVLSFIRIRSKKGGAVHITSPFLKRNTPVFSEGKEVSCVYDEQGILSFDTVCGGEYTVGSEKRPNAACGYKPQILTHETYTKRKIFLGEDYLTGYYKALDGALRDWYYGNCRHANHTVYKFDFGGAPGKVYTQSLTRPAHAAEQMVMKGMAFLPLGADALDFTVKRGYGFASAEGIQVRDRGIDDVLRRDFAEGTADAEFIIEAPRGQYELLVISGDEDGESVTVLQTENGFTAGGEVLKAGQYQCELIPVIQKRDTPIRLKISTAKGYAWKLNCIIMNQIKGY